MEVEAHLPWEGVAWGDSLPTRSVATAICTSASRTKGCARTVRRWDDWCQGTPNKALPYRNQK